MNTWAWCGAAVVLAAIWGGQVQASGWRKDNNELVTLNKRLAGKVMDHTANHGRDLRIMSRSLWQRRDLYVYLPPGFNPEYRYPLMIWLHGFGQDEQSFLKFVVPVLDDAIAKGKLPPLIVAAPDGSVHGEPSVIHPSTFFLDSQLGDYESFVLQDVWDFLCQHYPIRPEREAHILAGVSMGGFAAYNLGIRHRQAFGVVIGIMPPLNLRWTHTEGNHLSDFDPFHWGWRTEVHAKDVVGKYYGLVGLRVRELFAPLFDCADGNLLVEMSRINPIELVDRTCLRNGELAMYVAYGGKDEFNIDAQVESFLYLAHFRRLRIDVGYEPDGRHNAVTAMRFAPSIIDWLAPRIACYSPPMVLEGTSPIISVPPGVVLPAP